MAEDKTQAPGSALTAPVQSAPVPSLMNETAATQIVRRNIQILRPIMQAVDLVALQQEGRDLIKRLLVDGRDYGKVPGVSKPTLLKPGAEKYNAAYGIVARFTVTEQEVDHHIRIEWTKRQKEWMGPRGNRRQEIKETSGTSYGLYRYVILCELIDRGSGEVVGSSLGSASTLENKYVDRPRDLENTIIKMAEKRAYIGATLLTHGLSEQFTQDVEDTGVASDDTAAVQTIEPDPGPGAPDIGSAEWAIAYPINSPLHRALKLADDVWTFGQLTWKQLETVIEGTERLKVSKPEKADVYNEVLQAARRMQEELEERSALADDAANAGTTSSDVPAAEPAPAFSVPQQSKPFQPMAADGGAGDTPARPPQTADGKDVNDDLPF